AFVGQNAFKSGQLAARLLEYGRGNDQYYLVTITKTTENNDILKQRIEGFFDYFRALGIKANISERKLHSEESGFEDNLRRLIATFKNGDKIFVPNSKVHQVASTLKDQSPNLKVLLLGYDLIPNNIKYLMDGTIDFLINQKPEVQG